MTDHQPRAGDHYADPASPGRVVRVLAVDSGDQGVQVETIKAADAAVTARAVGRITVVQLSTLRKFHYLTPS